MDAQKTKLISSLMLIFSMAACKPIEILNSAVKLEKFESNAAPAPDSGPSTPTPASADVPAGRSNGGSVDLTFGINGVIEPNFGSTPQLGPNREMADWVAFDPQGRTLVFGRSLEFDVHAILYRLNDDGSLDNTFQNGERSILSSLNRGYDYPCGVHPLPNGNIILTTQNYNSIGVGRLNSDGSADPTFGQNGVTALSVQSELCNSAIQPDGKIILVSYIFSQQQISVTRLSPNGGIDPSFGSAGTRTITFGSAPSNRDITIEPQTGRIFILADIQGLADRESRLIALNSNGSLAIDFGNNGILSFNAFFGQKMALNNGKLLISGRDNSTQTRKLTLKRHLLNGSPDFSFGGTGSITHSGCWSCTRIAFDSLGNTLLSGEASSPSALSTFGILRIDSDGAVDRTFGISGLILHQFGAGTYNTVNSLSIDPTGKLLVAGFRTTNSREVFSVARFLP